MKTLENIEYLFIPGGALSSYHQVVTKLHFQTQYPGVSVMICSNYDPAELKVYTCNVILIKLNSLIPMVSIILTMGMFCQQH